MLKLKLITFLIKYLIIFASTLNVKTMSAIDENKVMRKEMINRIVHSGMPSIDPLTYLFETRIAICKQLRLVDMSDIDEVSLNWKLDYINEMISINLNLK